MGREWKTNLRWRQFPQKPGKNIYKNGTWTGWNRGTSWSEGHVGRKREMMTENGILSRRDYWTVVHNSQKKKVKEKKKKKGKWIKKKLTRGQGCGSWKGSVGWKRGWFKNYFNERCSDIHVCFGGKRRLFFPATPHFPFPFFSISPSLHIC